VAVHLDPARTVTDMVCIGRDEVTNFTVIVETIFDQNKYYILLKAWLFFGI
jgi:hypothetical protein